MPFPCPAPRVWLRVLEAGGLPLDLQAHVDACEPCRQELASLASSGPLEVPASLRARLLGIAPRPAFALRLAAAALLLAAGLGAWAGLRGNRQSPAAVAGPGNGEATRAAEDPAPPSLLFGASGQLLLAQGALGRLEEAPVRTLVLDRGDAWLETFGDPVRIVLAGCPAVLECRDATLAVSVGTEAPSLGWLIHSAQASESEGSAWGIRVVRGEATFRSGPEARSLRAGDAMGSLAPAPDPCAWKEFPSGALPLRDGLASFPVGKGFRVAEMLVRKREASAEAAVLFSLPGRALQVPLGVHLAEGRWLRLRLESGSGGIRLLAGDRVLAEGSGTEVAQRLYPGQDGVSWGLRAWGGDLEILQARWR